MTDSQYRAYLTLLRQELIPATGCTEPIAIAYAAAKARDVLGALPERIAVRASGNVIKNVKSVVVPGTGGLRGIPAAAAAGAAAGRAEAELEVLARATAEDARRIAAYLDATPIAVEHVSSPHPFDVTVAAYAGDASAAVRLAGHHTNVVSVEKNGETLISAPLPPEADNTRDSGLTVAGIVEFADQVRLEDVRALLNRQIQCNMAIAEEGLRSPCGANIGKHLLRGHENDLDCRMRAYAAAASDARMSGCELPVVINSGSGNQGITASVPVIVYARGSGKTEDELLRALCVSNLVTLHLKAGIGRLSAYCGVVSAGCGAASGVAYLQGGRLDSIAHTIVNSLAVDSGIICDGAKASCAAKIASAVGAGLLGLEMYRSGDQFYGGDGIVKKGVENTIACISRLAREGMRQTDEEIIHLMMDE